MNMDSKRIEKLIMKALLKEISEGERCELDGWLNAFGDVFKEGGGRS